MLHITQPVMDQITDIFNRRKAAIGLSAYSVGELLDHGGMSNVYRINDSAGNTEYVLRVSEEHTSPYSNDVFNEREIRILQELKKNRQPHVVQFLDAFVADIPGQPRYYCAVMKFLCTLKQYRVSGDGVEIAVRLGCDFLPLLQSFSDKGILHRDIKPENIFYDGDFRNDTGFLLGDFGIAKHDTETSVTPTGTEYTMAPEMRGLDRALRSDRFRSDMYSLGMVMYRYLNEGIYPSNRERIDKMPPDKNPFPEPRYGSKRLKGLVLRATSYDPETRFASPQAMLRELQKCDEYRQYILHETDEINATVDAAKFIAEENERLRRQYFRQQMTTGGNQPAYYDYDYDARNNMMNGNAPAAPIKGPRTSVVIPVLTAVVSVLFVIVILLVIVVFSKLEVSPSTEDDSDDGSVGSVSESYDDRENAASESVNPKSENRNETALRVGEHIYFGHYKQGADGEVQPIEWRVLAVQNGKALLITDKLLDYVAYNDYNKDVTWETCSMRRWMNNTFLRTAFSSSERKKIASVTVDNPDNAKYGTEGGSATQDKIFALSIDEAFQYFSSDDDRRAFTTDYAHIPQNDADDRSDYWWFRSPGAESNLASDAHYLGSVNQKGYNVDYTGTAVRPALWMNLE